MHVFCLGTTNKIVAVHSQDSIRTCKPHAVLAVHCNYYVYVRVCLCLSLQLGTIVSIPNAEKKVDIQEQITATTSQVIRK